MQGPSRNTTFVTTYDYWQEQPWAVTRDPSLAFDAELLDEALEVWRAQSGPAGVPQRSALSARTLKPFLPNLVIVERQDDGRYRIRLMGSRISLMIGEMQGHMLEECLPPDAVKRWTDAFDSVLSELRPVRYVSSVTVLDLDFLRAEILLAPLLDGAQRPVMVLAVATFRSRASADRAARPLALEA